MQIIEQGTNLLKVFAPIAVLALAVLTAWGILKWYKRFGQAFKELTESPITFAFGIVVIILFIYVYLTYVAPLLK